MKRSDRLDTSQAIDFASAKSVRDGYANAAFVSVVTRCDPADGAALPRQPLVRVLGLTVEVAAPLKARMTEELMCDGRTGAGVVEHSSSCSDGKTSNDLCASLIIMLAGVFALHVKSKNFLKHAMAPHFGDYQLMLGEQTKSLFDMTDAIAERCCHLGGMTLRFIRHVAQLTRTTDQDAGSALTIEALGELRENNQQLIGAMRNLHATCEKRGDSKTVGLLETWIHEMERRAWVLPEITEWPAS